MQTFQPNTFKALNNKGSKVIALTIAATLIITGTYTFIQTRQKNPTTLKGYYAQTLSWSTCLDTYKHAELRVPIDYTNLTLGTFKIAVLKYEAIDPKHRIGSLVVNPGGPGAPRVDYAYNAEYIFSPDVTD